MKVSVVATVLNEEDSIGPLLDSLLAQTRKSDEIVIVDGGSKDNTSFIIEGFQEKHPIIKLLHQTGTIAQGRNTAIRAAKHSIIAQIDGGCIAKKDWLRKIITPFKDKQVGMVAGFYEMTGKTPFQEAVKPYHGVTRRNYDPRTFLPSARSMAFRKRIWEEVGGYPENLDRAGEDTLFNYKLIKAGVHLVRVPEAVVFWEVPKTWSETAKKLYYYAKGDAQAGIWWHPAQKLSTHNIKILSIFARYTGGFFLLILAFFVPVLFCLLFTLLAIYATWAIWKLKDEVTSFHSQLLLPGVQVLSDIVIMAGFFTGVLSKR